MVIITENETCNPSSNPICISLSVNTLAKGMNPPVLPLAMVKYLSKLGSLALVRELV